MKLPWASSARQSIGWLLLGCALVSARKILRSTSLATCMENSGFSANLFNVSFTPDDGQLRIRIVGESRMAGTVRAKVTVLAYGFKVMSQELDPCTTDGLQTMCPMTLQELDLDFQQTVDPHTVAQIPAIAYRIPDLDGLARLEVIDTAPSSAGQVVACVEAPLSNGQTVDQAAVGWITAIVSGLALSASAVVSGLGRSATAAHLAANALGLFGYFQAQAMVAMMAVPLPPLASAWTQNFDWAVGIIRIDFMQRLFHWYIQATSGHPDSLFKQQEDVSVQIARRSVLVSSVPSVPSVPSGLLAAHAASPLGYLLGRAAAPSDYLLTRAAAYGFAEWPPAGNGPAKVKRAATAISSALLPRSNNDALVDSTQLIRVTGIERMSYMAKVEASNFFMTGLSFFVAFLCFVMLGVAAFRLLCNTRLIRPSTFCDFRAEWLVVLKGIIYRVVLIGYPQMMILCAWELSHRDSPAAVTQAVFLLVFMNATLAWAAFKILRIGQHSAAVNAAGGPAYTLYSDPAALNRWGYLYVMFRPQAYYAIVPLLVYTAAKALAIAVGQTHGTAQSIVVCVIELAHLVAVATLRPWLDRRTNMVNIAIAAVNMVNAVLVVIFSGVTKAPEMVPGVLGVAFFLTNAIFALVLLVLLSITVYFAVFSKNPEERYRGDTPLPSTESTESAEKRVRDLDAEPAAPPAAGAAADKPMPPSPLPPPRSTHSRGESERGAASLHGHYDDQPPRFAQFQHQPSPSPRLVPLPPSAANSHYEPSLYSMHSQRGGSSRGYGASAPPSAAAGHYGDQPPQLQQRSPHGGMNWNVGAGFER